MLAVQTKYQVLCNYGLLNRSDWIGINVLVVLTFMMIGALLYALSGFLPTNSREKLRGIVRYEMVQGVISILIISALISFAFSSCQIGSILSSGYAYGAQLSYFDPIQYAQSYIGNMIFVQGTALVSELWSVGMIYMVDGNIVSWLVQHIAIMLPESVFGGGRFSVSFSPGIEITYIFFDYASIPGVYSGLVVVGYGMLFMVWLMLPIIEGTFLTILIPVAIVMRSLSFTGPRLREAANVLIAIAVAFYFVFPLTISMDSSIVSWLYCTRPGALQAGACNSFANELGPYPLNGLPVASIFQSQTNVQIPGIGGVSGVPINFYGAGIAGNGGFLPFLMNSIEGIFNAPTVIGNFIPKIGEYLFQSIVLLALDLAITVGFAQGLAKGLSAISGMMNIGPFW